MSHCVWEITNEMIVDILENESFKWSINELALIVQILAFAHNDSTIALALGLLPEENEQHELNLTKISEVISAYNDKIYDTLEEKLEKNTEILQLGEQTECCESEENASEQAE